MVKLGWLEKVQHKIINLIPPFYRLILIHGQAWLVREGTAQVINLIPPFFRLMHLFSTHQNGADS